MVKNIDKIRQNVKIFLMVKKFFMVVPVLCYFRVLEMEVSTIALPVNILRPIKA